MTGVDWIVVGSGVALIGFINWYFLLAPRTIAKAEVQGGAQAVTYWSTAAINRRTSA